MLTVHQLAEQTADVICKATCLEFSPRSTAYVTCAISAAMACIPVFIENYLACVAGGGATKPADYTPGDRERCD